MVRGLLVGISIAALALAGCSGDKPAATAEPTQAASAGPDAKPGLSVSGGRLVLPAVPGNPGAAYFTLANGGDAEATVAAVHIAGAARAEMHETTGGSMSPLKTAAIAPGKSVVFAPGGKHVMAFEIAETIKPGSTVELTLTFADGDKLSTPLAVEAAGGMGAMEGPMEGMDHGDQH